MSVVTIAEYRAIVGDDGTADAEVQRRLNRAELRIEEFLKRKLALGTYTDVLKVSDDDYGLGRGSCRPYAVHPLQTPIVSVSVPVNAILVDGVTVYPNGAWPWDMITEHEFDSIWPFRVTITYIGAWDTTTMPQTLKEAIITVATRMVPLSQLALTSVPIGAMRVKLGDAAIDFNQPFGSGGSLEALVPGITATLKKWQYRY